MKSSPQEQKNFVIPTCHLANFIYICSHSVTVAEDCSRVSSKLAKVNPIRRIRSFPFNYLCKINREATHVHIKTLNPLKIFTLGEF